MSLYPVEHFTRSRSSTPPSTSSSSRSSAESSPIPERYQLPHRPGSPPLTLPSLRDVLKENGIQPGHDSGRRGIPGDREEARAATLLRTLEAANPSRYRFEAPPPSAYPSYYHPRAYPPPPSNHAVYRREPARPYSSDGEVSFGPARSSTDSLDRPISSHYASDSQRRRGPSDFASTRPDTRRSRSYSDPRVHATASSLGKRGHMEHQYERPPSTVQPASDDDDDEEPNDAPYNEDCVVYRVQEFDQGPGKEPRKAFFNRKGVKLEIIKIEVKIDDRKYLQYAEPVPSDPTRWRCICNKMENGKPARCSYRSKKHLVKRHIEATHMNIKRFQCSWCGSTFTQRSNAENCHINTHSGESPHACAHCDLRFKDPSKLHKHLSRDHSEEVRLKRQRRDAARYSSQHDFDPQTV
ncbi:unnamed protein product [Peniophora sp. CBMAI 1063]|nr:unnamed protein product [Peniophora sp. CBMAI 1063]